MANFLVILFCAVARQAARGVAYCNILIVLILLATRKKVVAALPLLLREVELDNLSWTCVAKKLRDKLQGKFPSTPGPLQDAYSFRRSISTQTNILARLPLKQIVLRRLTQDHCCVVITLSKMFEYFI